VRSGRKRSTYTNKELKKDMEVFLQTGVHPHLQRVQQSSSSGDVLAPLPDPDPSRPHVFLDVTVDNKPAGEQQQQQSAASTTSAAASGAVGCGRGLRWPQQLQEGGGSAPNSCRVALHEQQSPPSATRGIAGVATLPPALPLPPPPSPPLLLLLPHHRSPCD
jgi:hypothetical protein